MKMLRELLGKVCKIIALDLKKNYNSIQTTTKPPQGLALIEFPDGFDIYMSYQLRERNLTTLEDMKRDVYVWNPIC